MKLSDLDCQTHAQAAKLLGTRNRRTVVNNTSLEREPNGDINVVLHETAVVTYHKDGSYTLRTGGYQTMTTKDRIDRMTPFDVMSVNGRWYVRYETDSVPFVEGMTVTPGQPLPQTDTSAEDEANKQMRKAIAKYVAGYTDDVIAGLVNDSHLGDCWFCLLFNKPESGTYFGAPTVRSEPSGGDEDHLRHHVEEDYRMFSLMANAVEAKGYAFPGAILAAAPSIVRSSLGWYLRKHLLTGVIAAK